MTKYFDSTTLFRNPHILVEYLSRYNNMTKKSINYKYCSGEPPKKKVKKLHYKCELWGGGGQQILVCEPQKSAFFRANFPKKHAEINS